MSTFCCLPLSFNPPIFHRPQSPLYERSLCSPFPSSKLSSSLICFSISPANNSNYEREEARWLREEQRWLREEQRWLREEKRWHAEREDLLTQITALKLRIEEWERQSKLQGGSVPNAAALLRILNRIAESGSSAVPIVLEVAQSEKVQEELEVVKEEVVEGKKEAKQMKKRETLRKGSEGDNVRAMQEALQKIGFYCGEEDVEYSSFSSGTERAVKTWQATLGTPEDGIMTAELQERLYMEHQVGFSSLPVHEEPRGKHMTAAQKDGANGAVVASITEISEIQHKIVEDKGASEIDVSQHRVFLLGENRWEEPSRLSGRNRQVDGAKSKGSTTECLSCRGEGRMLCTECDGTGEPNIEPQFLEWIDEGMKCPYCEGHGFTTCDICEGKGEAVV